MAIADHTRLDVQKWVASPHKTPVAADRSAPMLSVILTQAEVYGYRTEGSNPCTGVKCYRGRGRERFLTTDEVRRLSRVLEETRSRALITLLGPDSIVNLDFHVSGVGDIAMFQTHTPVEPPKQRVACRWFAARRLPRILVSCVIGNWVSQWRQDVKIWQGKIDRRSPPGIAEDDPLGRMRAWYGQFYPDGLAECPCGACDHGE